MLAGASRAVRRWWLHPELPGLRHGRKCARLCRSWCAPVARSLAATCGGRASHASGCVGTSGSGAAATWSTMSTSPPAAGRYRATDCGAGLAILWDASAIKKPVRFAHCARRWKRISWQTQGTLRGQGYLGSAFRASRRRAPTHLAVCHRPSYERQGFACVLPPCRSSAPCALYFQTSP